MSDLIERLREDARHLGRYDAFVQNQYSADCAAAADAIERLAAECDALRTVLGHAAAIAHNGGLAGLDPHSALIELRRLTLPYFDRTGSSSQATEAVRAAIENKEFVKLVDELGLIRAIKRMAGEQK